MSAPRLMDRAVHAFAASKSDAVEAHARSCEACYEVVTPNVYRGDVVLCAEMRRLLGEAAAADLSAFWAIDDWAREDDALTAYLESVGQADPAYLLHCQESIAEELVRSHDEPALRRLPEDDDL